MQIFLTNKELRQCAKDLDDKRLNKIIVESMQIISTSFWINDCDAAETLYSEKKIYLPTHEHHPLVKWCAENNDNYSFVIIYCIHLCYEYKFRFGKFHKTLNILYNLISKRYINFYPIEENIKMPNATTNHKHIKNIYEAYKKELILKWNNDKIKPKWTKRDKPNWYKNN